MRFLILLFFAFMCFACTQEAEYIPCESGHGYLYKDGREFVCPFAILKQIGPIADEEWLEEKKVTVLASDVGEYFPLKRRNAPYAYNLSMKVPKEYLIEEQYTVSLQTIDNKTHKSCGESKETIFYKITEDENTIEYRTIMNNGYGTKIFFGAKEMPSYDWYHVLKTCDGNSFFIKGEVINE